MGESEILCLLCLFTTATFSAWSSKKSPVADRCGTAPSSAGGGGAKFTYSVTRYLPVGFVQNAPCPLPSLQLHATVVSSCLTPLPTLPPQQTQRPLSGTSNLNGGNDQGRLSESGLDSESLRSPDWLQPLGWLQTSLCLGFSTSKTGTMTLPFLRSPRG